jgi:hypothetical protein
MIFVVVDLQYMTSLRGIDFAAALSLTFLFLSTRQSFMHEGNQSRKSCTCLANLFLLDCFFS